MLLLNLWIISQSFSMHFYAQNTAATKLITTQKVFKANEDVILEFETSVTTNLYCHSSYGSTIVYPNYELGEGFFNIPDFLTRKKGIIDFQLIADKKSIYIGSISIIADPKSTTHLESYIGPPGISAGTHDYTMLVVIPTDAFDNPVANEKPVNIKHLFSESFKEETVQTTNFIAWKNIYSHKSSGRILVSSSVDKTSSKEFSIEVFPAQPTNFTIDYTQKHPYADGNQITTFTTSVIKDQYGNVISDGTLVNFVIKNAQGMILKTQGSSIKGVAIANMLHPDHEETWKVTAYINGMALSPPITLKYAPVTTELPVVFNENNRKIMVGPLHSFMSQLIPNGTVVKLFISKNNQFLETKLKTTSNGVVNFELKEGFYPQGIYSFTIEALGLKSKYVDIKL